MYKMWPTGATQLTPVTAHRLPSAIHVASHFSKMCNCHKKQTPSRHCPKHTMKYVRDESSDSGSDNDCQNEYTFSMAHGETVTVVIGNVPVTMLIDVQHY